MALLFSILAFFIIAGKLLDNYMYKNEKFKLYVRMEKWVEKISDTKNTKLHIVMIDWTLRFFNKIFDLKRRPLQTLASSIILSWILTSVSFNIGRLHPISLYEVNAWHDYLPWYQFVIL